MSDDESLRTRKTSDRAHQEVVAAILTAAFVPLLHKTIEPKAEHVASAYRDILGALRAKHR